MEPDNYSPYIQQNNTQSQNSLRWFVVVISGLFIIIGIWLFVATFIGYSHISFTNIPKMSQVKLNGHIIQTDSPIKVRPGTYTVSISSPTTEPYEDEVKTSMYRTTEFKPELNTRPTLAIVTSLIGANGQYGVPTLDNADYSHNNSWLTGIVGPGSAIPFAAEFSDGSWHVRYFLSSGYPQDTSKLPADVAAQIKTAEAQYAQ